MSRQIRATIEPPPLPAAVVGRWPAGWILAAGAVLYLLIISGGTLELRRPNVREGGGQLSFDRAVFLATSATTLTGFQQSIGFNDFKPENALGPTILLLLTVAGTLLTLTLSALAAVRALRLPYTDLHVILAALVAEGAMLLVGSLLLLGCRVPIFDAMQQAASAFGNSGAVITAHHHLAPTFKSAAAQLVLLPLAILGGLGLVVLMEVWYRVTGGIRPLSRHANTVIALTAGVYLAATLILFIPAYSHAQTLAGDAVFMNSHPNFDGSARAAFAAASTTAINTRTVGLPFETLDYFPAPAQWLLVALMMIGSNSAGTGGGLKTTTLYVIVAGFMGSLRGRAVPRIFGIAGAWLGVYMLLAGASFICLSAIETGLNASEGIFLVVSALSNVGLSHGPVMIVGNGMFLLALVMFLGRILPLAVLWWMTRTARDGEVLVG